MKKLFTIISLFCCVALSAQTQFTRSSAVTTPMDPHLRTGFSFGLPIYYTDTSAYNGLDSLGTEIYIPFEGVYVRDTIDGVGHKWTLQLDGNSQYWQLNGSLLSPVSTSYNVGIGTSAPSYKFHVLNGSGNLGFDASGRLILYNNISNHNIAIGESATGISSSKQYNISIGYGANQFSNGDANIAIGATALLSAGNGNNTAVGLAALYATDSTDNSGFGYNAGIGNYGTRNVSIGSTSGNFAIVLQTAALSNSDVVTSTSTLSGADIATFITNAGLSIGVRYVFNTLFAGTPPSPYTVTGGFTSQGTVTNSNTISFPTQAVFTTQGSGGYTLTVYNKQDNSIAIGYNARTIQSNQIVLGNTNNTRLQANTFNVDITDVPHTGESLVWQAGGYAAWDTVAGGGGSIGTFLLPLLNTAGVVSINNATTSTVGAASFNASDFNVSSGAVTIDYTNGQAASATLKGFLTNTDWTTFNGKLSNITGYISAGTNITITGSGTFGSPYTINSSGGGGGITSLDGLTAASQTFAVGSTGTSPSWSVAAGSIHSINLPTTSAANTGLVTPTLYNAWQAKAEVATGAITTVYSSNLSANLAVISNGSGKLATSTATSTDLTNLVAQYTGQTLTDGATITMNCNSGYNGTVTIAGNRTMAFTNVTNWHPITIRVTQDGTGNRTLTFPANSLIPIGFGTGTVLNLSTSGGAIDVIYVIYDGSNYLVTLAKDFVN